MNDDAPTIEDELTRRLGDLAGTTTVDPGAWDRIEARTSATAASTATGRWPGGLRPDGRRLLAAAAAAVVVAGGLTVAVVRDDGGDRVRTDEGPTTTAPATTPSTREPSTTTSSSVPDAGPPAPDPAPEAESPARAPEGDPPAEPCPDDDRYRCVGTGSGDVDGDGAADQVGLYIEPAGDASARIPVTVRVVYASGSSEEHRVDGFEWGAELLGVTDLDGDGREEVAYLYDGGAHSSIGGFAGTAVTGRLHGVGFPAPRVLLDGAALESAGFSCPDVDGDGRRELVVADAYDRGDGTFQVHTVTYRWAGDRLEQADETTDTVPPAGDADGDGVDDVRDGVYGPRCGDLRAPSS